ncbi:hypothetical protein HanPSC8_Chr17g0765701 [Helianthus annuus]|nr:hypothetical protein HanPSC8_Chr17g0765701 [Helianthus annuus]
MLSLVGPLLLYRWFDEATKTNPSDGHQHLHNYNSHQRVFQEDFDSTIAYINHEQKQRLEETTLGAEFRNIRGQTLMNGNTSRQATRVQLLDSTRLSDSKSSETSTSLWMNLGLLIRQLCHLHQDQLR